MDNRINFVLSNQTISLNAIDPDIDHAFIELHKAFFLSQVFDWSEMNDLVISFLQNNPDRNGIHNRYFDNFTVIWNALLARGAYGQAEILWKMALQPVIKFESENIGREVHKGTAYYFWGITALLDKDLDKGFALMHKAFEEDKLTTRKEFPDTPAYAFVTLDYSKLDQAFGSWVFQRAQYLKECIAEYSEEFGRQFTLDDFRNKFLKNQKVFEITFPFSYIFAKIHENIDIPFNWIKTHFSSQMHVYVFFELILCIDNLIKQSNPRGRNFLNHANFLSTIVNHPVTDEQLKEINKSFYNKFDHTLDSLLKGDFSFQDGSRLNKIQSYIAIAYGMRNRGGHNLRSSKIVMIEHQKILKILLNVFFMAVDWL